MCRGVKHLQHCSCRRYFFPRFTTFLARYTLALASLKNAKNERLLCRVFILFSSRQAARHFLPTVTCRFATSFFAPYRSCFAEESSRFSFKKKLVSAMLLTIRNVQAEVCIYCATSNFSRPSLPSIGVQQKALFIGIKEISNSLQCSLLALCTPLLCFSLLIDTHSWSGVNFIKRLQVNKGYTCKNFISLI